MSQSDEKKTDVVTLKAGTVQYVDEKLQDATESKPLDVSIEKAREIEIIQAPANYPQGPQGNLYFAGSPFYGQQQRGAGPNVNVQVSNVQNIKCSF